MGETTEETKLRIILKQQVVHAITCTFSLSLYMWCFSLSLHIWPFSLFCPLGLQLKRETNWVQLIQAKQGTFTSVFHKLFLVPFQYMPRMDIWTFYYTHFFLNNFLFSIISNAFGSVFDQEEVHKYYTFLNKNPVFSMKKKLWICVKTVKICIIYLYIFSD